MSETFLDSQPQMNNLDAEIRLLGGKNEIHGR